MSGFPGKGKGAVICNLVNHRENWCSDGICEHFLPLCSVLELRRQGLPVEVVALGRVAAVTTAGSRRFIGSAGMRSGYRRR